MLELLAMCWCHQPPHKVPRFITCLEAAGVRVSLNACWICGTVLVLLASTHLLGCSRLVCLDAVDFRVLLNTCWMCEKRFKTEREAARARAERSVAEVG